MTKKDKKLAILLLVIVLATLLIVYFVYFNKPNYEPINDDMDIMMMDKESQELDLGVLEDPRFKELKQRGQLTFPEEIGNPNPFNQ